jgi:membrane-bound ClpP family serine protease
MWVIAGILLGLVILGCVLGFHAGPHVHGAAAILGALAAGWLLLIAATGPAPSALWVLLSADVVVSGGVGTLAWKGLTHRGSTPPAVPGLEGAEGFAVSELTPDGIVRVNGENWTARSVNGPVAAGTAVQVLRTRGVRLEVWGEQNSSAPAVEERQEK